MPLLQLIAKQIRILENRLSDVLKRYNQSLQTNRQLREGVDDCRRERGKCWCCTVQLQVGSP